MDLNFTKVLSMTLYRSQIWMETPRNTKHMHMWKPYDVSHAFSCPSGGYSATTHELPKTVAQCNFIVRGRNLTIFICNKSYGRALYNGV